MTLGFPWGQSGLRHPAVEAGQTRASTLPPQGLAKTRSPFPHSGTWLDGCISHGKR
jgi:hypothetical protein